MINNYTFEAITNLNRHGQHGWSFSFNSYSGDVDELLDYLLSNSVSMTYNELHDRLADVVNYLRYHFRSGKFDNFSVTLGYNSLQVRIYHTPTADEEYKELLEAYQAVAKMLSGPEKLLYVSNYQWLARDGQDYTPYKRQADRLFPAEINGAQQHYVSVTLT